MPRRAGWTAATLAALAATSCWAQETVVHVGVTKSLASATTMIAVEKGYFQDAGIKVQLTQLDSAANVITLLAQNRLQIVEGGVTAGFFSARERGMPISIVADRASSPLNHKLLVRSDLSDTIKSIADLKGGSIASNGAGTVTTYEIGKILASAGLNVKDVDIKIMSFPQMGVALTSKAIAAALAIQPWASEYVDQGMARVVADPDDYADPRPLTIAVNMINTDWAKSNPQLARDYYTAYERAAYDYCQAYHHGPNRAEVVDIIVKTGIEDRPETLNRYPWPARNPNGHVNKPGLLDMREYFKKRGPATRETPIDDFVDYQYVDYATSKLGPFDLQNKQSPLAGCR